MKDFMKGNSSEPSKYHLDLEDIDMETILESDLEDYEIAAELGMSLGQISQIRRDLFEG